ncbi:Glyoxalase-like domain protein [Bifidobacterium thermophilum]|nr:Glyoxalase-like domain protein [Bifidobacterium thermophilum]
MGTGIASINHVALYVNDLEAAKDFFVTYLGATSNDEYHNPTTDFRSYFLSFDGNTRLDHDTPPAWKITPSPFARTGYVHVAFSLGSTQAVDDLTARLKADGYEVLSGPRTTGDGYYESCIIAIEGNQIELTV